MAGEIVIADELLTGGKLTGQAGSRTARELKRVGEVFNPEIPSLEIPEEEEEDKDLLDEEAARELAMKRRSLERARRGRSSLRIDAPARNPGVASTAISGLRIP